MANQFSFNLKSLTTKAIAAGQRTLPHLSLIAVALFLLVGAAHAQAGYGEIVLSSDEYMFIDGYLNNQCCQDPLFAMNIARFLVPLQGTILIQSTFSGGGQGLDGTRLAALLRGMGASVVEVNTCPSVDFLSPFDAVFVSGDPTGCPMTPMGLITYVNNGGHVFLEVGTGCCGGARREAAIWNLFLNPFGLNVATTYNNISPSVPVSAFQTELPFGPSLFESVAGGLCIAIGPPCRVSNVVYSQGQDISTVVPTEDCNVGSYGQVFSETIGGEMHGLYAAMKCCPRVFLQSSISALVNGPYGTAYVPSADWFSFVPNASQIRVEPRGTARFWEQTMTGTEPVASCASNPV